MCYYYYLRSLLSSLPLVGISLACLLGRLLLEPGNNGFSLLPFFGCEIHWSYANSM